MTTSSLAQSSCAVSYTHLDVYKRQAQWVAESTSVKHPGREWVYDGMPVSYTHLDVYKRQIMYNVANNNMACHGR